MGLKDLFLCSCLLMVSIGLDLVVSVPTPEHYHEGGGYHGEGHNQIVDYYVSLFKIQACF
jgi:hypothetical protein